MFFVLSVQCWFSYGDNCNHFLKYFSDVNLNSPYIPGDNLTFGPFTAHSLCNNHAYHFMKVSKQILQQEQVIQSIFKKKKKKNWKVLRSTYFAATVKLIILGFLLFMYLFWASFEGAASRLLVKANLDSEKSSEVGKHLLSSSTSQSLLVVRGRVGSGAKIKN